MLYFKVQCPPTRTTAMATLKESLCMRAGIRIATFALIEDYFGMEWVEFVDQLTRLCRGVAFVVQGAGIGELRDGELF